MIQRNVYYIMECKRLSPFGTAECAFLIREIATKRMNTTYMSGDLALPSSVKTSNTFLYIAYSL